MGKKLKDKEKEGSEASTISTKRIGPYIPGLLENDLNTSGVLKMPDVSASVRTVPNTVDYLSGDHLAGFTARAGLIDNRVLTNPLSSALPFVGGSVTANNWLSPAVAISPGFDVLEKYNGSVVSGLKTDPSTGFVSLDYDRAIAGGSSLMTPSRTAFMAPAESSTEKAQREQREDTRKVLDELQKMQKSESSGEGLGKKMEELKRQLDINAQESSPQFILEKLPTLLIDFVRYNKIEIVEALKDQLIQRDIHWSCGFGHKVEVIKSLPRLKEILSEQVRGEVHKCEYGHQSTLLISGTKILTISLDDIGAGRIRGGFKKQNKKNGKTKT